MGSEVSNRNKTSYSGARVAPENLDSMPRLSRFYFLHGVLCMGRAMNITDALDKEAKIIDFFVVSPMNGQIFGGEE